MSSCGKNRNTRFVRSLYEIVRCGSLLMRRTRIVSTLGPATADPDGIRRLIAAGTDAFRLNFSHGTHASHAEACRLARAAAAEAGKSVAVLQDLSGPKIRIGAVAAPLTLERGGTLAIELGDFAGGPGRVSCAFEALFASVPAGARLLLDDGRLEVEVTGVSATRLDTRVVTGGVLESHKGINIPGVELKTPAMTPKDAADLAAGIKMGVDLVAVSFVQSPDDMRLVRAAARAAGAPHLPLIAKIEKPRAVERIEDILDESDGIMVARGDLGIELPLETIPGVQRRLVQAARRRGIPVIVATQVLESMISAPRPTRAEVTDAAHVVDEGADAVLLAGETAVGQYAASAVATLDRILSTAEQDRPAIEPPRMDGRGWSAHSLALAEAAVALATRANADAIVALTEGGNTPRLLAALRPHADILAVTSNPATAARLAIVWGVRPCVAPSDNPDAVRRVLREQALVRTGAVTVFVSIDPALATDSDRNFARVELL
jgi:pyruvate kinase